MPTARTSESHPLRITAMTLGDGRGRIGFSQCPGRIDRYAISGAWRRDLDTDLDAIQHWGATAVVSLISHEELTYLKVQCVEQKGDQPMAQRYRVANEDKKRYQQELGEELGTVFHGLWKNWFLGWVRLNEIRVLFSDAGTVKLLNTVTGGVFLWDVQHLMMDDLMLCVTRLTDQQRSGGKENLTVRWLPKLCEDSDICKDPDLPKEVEQLVDEAVRLAKPARRYRNQQISHIDLGVEKDEQAEIVPRATLDEVQAAMDAVLRILNAISGRLLDKQLADRVVTHGRGERFISNSRGLARAVQLADSLIDPTGTGKFTDFDVADAFLKKTGQPRNPKNTAQITRLRELADLFKKDQD